MLAQAVRELDAEAIAITAQYAAEATAGLAERTRLETERSTALAAAAEQRCDLIEWIAATHRTLELQAIEAAGYTVAAGVLRDGAPSDAYNNAYEWDGRKTVLDRSVISKIPLATVCELLWALREALLLSPLRGHVAGDTVTSEIQRTTAAAKDETSRITRALAVLTAPLKTTKTTKTPKKTKKTKETK